MANQTLPLARCENVEVFASGVFRGKTYTPDDLDQIARNFYELGPEGKSLLSPPLVLGHEENQSFLERTDLPAAGWLENVRVKRYHDQTSGKEEAILLADFAEVPPVIAKLINGRAYKKVSPEVYDDFQDDFENSYGKALRRVSLLGGEIPQIKRLENIPLARFSERRAATHKLMALLGKRMAHAPCVLKLIAANKTNRGTFQIFAEVQSMFDRATAIQAILAAMPNLPQTAIDTMTDDQLSALQAALPQAAAPMEPMPADVPAMADLPREDMIADLVAAGQDAAALEAMTDDELKALYDQLTGSVAPMADMSRDEMIQKLVSEGHDAASLEGKSDEELKAMLGTTEAPPAEAPMAEINKPAPAPSIPVQRTQQPGATMPTNTPAKPTPAQPKTITLKYAEQAEREAQAALADVSALRQQVAGERAKLAKERREAKRARIEVFCEKLVYEGRIRPVDKDAYVEALSRCDDQKPAVKFSENGKEELLTQLDAKMREYGRLSPVIKFGEKIKAPAGGDDASEVAKVRRFAESDVMRDALKAAGKTPAQFVHTFSEKRKRDPEWTAAKHGVPAEYCA